MNINLTAPKSWKELSSDQLVFVAKQFLLKASREEFLIRCFLKFTGVRLLPFCGENVFSFRYKKQSFVLSADALAQFCEQLAYLVDTLELPVAPNLKGRITPEKHLYACTLESFLKADNLYTAFAESGEEKLLDAFIDVLYKKQGRGRLSVPHKYAVYLWYTALKVWLKEEYPLVFSGAQSDEERSPHKQLLDLLACLNKDSPQDNYRILGAHVHEVLHTLNCKNEKSRP